MKSKIEQLEQWAAALADARTVFRAGPLNGAYFVVCISRSIDLTHIQSFFPKAKKLNQSKWFIKQYSADLAESRVVAAALRREKFNPLDTKSIFCIYERDQ